MLYDYDAVSHVMGVILMVAITVIPAAVIVTFVRGLGDQVSSTPPQASFTFDYTNGFPGSDRAEGSISDSSGQNHTQYGAVVNVTHSGGAMFKAGNLPIRSAPDVTNTLFSDSDAFGASSSEVKAGDQLSVAIDSDETIRVTWESDTGQNSVTIREFSGPDAWGLRFPRIPDVLSAFGQPTSAPRLTKH